MLNSEVNSNPTFIYHRKRFLLRKIEIAETHNFFLPVLVCSTEIFVANAFQETHCALRNSFLKNLFLRSTTPASVTLHDCSLR